MAKKQSVAVRTKKEAAARRIYVEGLNHQIACDNSLKNNARARSLAFISGQLQILFVELYDVYGEMSGWLSILREWKNAGEFVEEYNAKLEEQEKLKARARKFLQDVARVEPPKRKGKAA